MNAEKPDKLSEGALAPEFSSGRHSSVRRREPANGGQDGRGLRRLIQNLGEQILVAVGGRDPRVVLFAGKRVRRRAGAQPRDSGLDEQRVGRGAGAAGPAALLFAGKSKLPFGPGLPAGGSRTAPANVCPRTLTV